MEFVPKRFTKLIKIKYSKFSDQELLIHKFNLQAIIKFIGESSVL